MKKSVRDQVFNKCGGKCAYCGCDLQKGWNVDHIEPIFRNSTDAELERYGIVRGKECLDNYMPACPRCNKWKSTYTIEQFRKEIAEQIQRLNNYSPGYRLAKAFGLIEEQQKEVKFYFETIY